LREKCSTHLDGSDFDSDGAELAGGLDGLLQLGTITLASKIESQEVDGANIVEELVRLSHF
jgi:hypothetical protein